MKKQLIALLLLSQFSLVSYAQENLSWEQYLNQMNELEEAETDSWDNAYEILSDYAEHPLNINTATREDLERLPFLNNQQIEDICAYLYQYGPMKSLGELAMIESLDYPHRKLLEYFIEAGDVKENTFPSLQNIWKYGKNELTATVKVPFYTRKGDKDGYLGYPYKHWMRYQFNYSDFVKFGLVGANDAGEPFFANRNSAGYDYYSFYLVLRRLGRSKTLAVGRYRLKFGMGLVMNNDFDLGKIATLSSLGRSTNAIRAHSSRSEANYLQGAATTVNLYKGLDLSAFVSYRYIDATLNTEDNTIATIVKTGYHRTQTEMDKKNNSSEFLAGGNLHYTWNGFHVGATGVFNSFDKEIVPKTAQRYRQYYAAGKSFYNLSTDYGYSSRRLSFNGETATGDCHALATINSLSYMPTSELSLMLLQRFYSYQYYALHAMSFSEGGSVQNESGVYLGVNWNPSRLLSVMAYTDYAYFAWPKYQANAASHAWDNYISINYQPRQWLFYARYRLKIRQKDNADKTGLINKTEQRIRLACGYEDNGWSTKLQGDLALCRYKEKSFGWMLSENLTYTHRWLKLNATVGHFHTDDYDSRLYVYERGPLYNYNYPSFYGEGIRYTFFAHAELGKHILLIGKLGITDYFDRDHISSSYQQINHSSQTDLDLQVRWRF